jgi:hypothetical protein
MIIDAQENITHGILCKHWSGMKGLFFSYRLRTGIRKGYRKSGEMVYQATLQQEADVWEIFHGSLEWFETKDSTEAPCCEYTFCNLNIVCSKTTSKVHERSKAKTTVG